MLVFSTRIPLKEITTQEDFLALCVRWVNKSQHYSLKNLDFDLSSHADFNCSNEGITFSVRHYKDEKVEISACRLENEEKNVIWTNDCIFLNESGIKSVLIQLNCNRKDFNTTLPFIHKPYIVRLFVESDFCDSDNKIPVTSSVIKASEDNYSICSEIINGNYLHSMPVVYISHNYCNHSPVSSENLASALGGLAHVIEEGSSQTAKQLFVDAPERNVYGGYVGLYCPGSSYFRKFGPEYYTTPRDMSQAITDSVWKVLINRSDSANYNWNQISALQAKQKMNKVDALGKKALDDYADTFDRENNQLRERIEALNDEINKLTADRDRLLDQLSSIKAKSFGNEFYKRGTEPELYPNEANDLLFSILSQVKIRYPENSRASALISSMLEANPKSGACKRIMGLIQEALGNSGGKLTKSAKLKLIDAGFSIDESGPHYKITFHDSRYMFTVSKTPSEYREGKNLLSDIRKIIDVERKV